MLVGGRIKGLKERLRGQIGVTRIEGWEGWIRGPDADNEYAVDPVGVERINPSACHQRLSWGKKGTMASVRKTPSMEIFSIVR